MRLPSVRRDSNAAEDRQEEHSFADLVQVISLAKELCSLPAAPMESKKVLGFGVVQDSDKQLFSSYCLLIGDASSTSILDVDDHMSSPPSGMWSKKIMKLLHNPIICWRRYYHFEGKEVVYHRTLLRTVTA